MYKENTEKEVKNNQISASLVIEEQIKKRTVGQKRVLNLWKYRKQIHRRFTKWEVNYKCLILEKKIYAHGAD